MVIDRARCQGANQCSPPQGVLILGLPGPPIPSQILVDLRVPTSQQIFRTKVSTIVNEILLSSLR